METKANYVLVGIFAVVTLLAAFLFIYWTARLGDTGETVELRVRIPGSAAGLGRGSFVLFNGVKVGDVRRVYLDLSNPEVAIADTLIDRLTPITRSTSAGLGIQGLTGQAHIELKGGNPDEPNLLQQAEDDDTVAVISADPSAVTNLLQTAQDIFTRAEAVLGGLETFISEARPPLLATIENGQKFSGSLARNADSIDSFLKNVGSLSDTLGTVSSRLESTLKAAEDVLNAVNRDKLNAVMDNVETFTGELSSASRQLDGILQSVDKAVKSIDQFSIRASGTLAKVDTLMDGVDPERVTGALANIEQASQSARQAAQDIAQISGKFSSRSEDIDRIITDASELAGRLNSASVRIDGVLAKVDGLLGSGEGQGVFEEAGKTLKSFQRVADNLNARIGPITDGLARFSGQGLREFEALLQDARRSINRIEQSVSSFERNPQRIITGGEGSVPRYNSRQRR